MRAPTLPRPLTLLLIALAAGGCVTTPESTVPLPVPAVQTAVDHFAGTPLGGPSAESVEVDAGEAWPVTMHCRALERYPADVFEPVGARLRLVVADDDGAPIRPVPEHTGAMRFSAGIDADAFDEVCSSVQSGRSHPFPLLHGAVVRGTTAVFSLRGDGETGPDPRLPPPEIRGSLLVHRTETDAIQVALEWHRVGVTRTHRELGVIDDQTIGDARRFAFVSQSSRYKHDWPAAYAVFVEIGAAPASEATVRRLSADLSAATAGATLKADPTLPDPAFLDAIDGLTWRTRQFDALRYLSRVTGARLASDLIASMSEATMRAIAADVHYQVLAKTAEAGAAPDRAGLGWLIERITLQTLLRQITKLENDGLEYPAEWTGVLVRHTGEVGRDPGTLDALIRASTSLEDLERRIVTENRYFLEDVSPAARIRAFDWLTMRGIRLGDYDPLALARTRRAALRRAEAADEAEGAKSPATNGAPQ